MIGANSCLYCARDVVGHVIFPQMSSATGAADIYPVGALRDWSDETIALIVVLGALGTGH